MPNPFSRTELLLGKTAVERLASSRVAIFGIGGVGGYVCEALARSGVGAFDLIDNDRVSLTNLNRQIIATHDTIGQPKTEVMRARILSVNPLAKVHTHNCFFLPENADEFSFADYDYVVDAVDTVSAKLALVTKCAETGTPIISCMGAGNKLDPTAFRVSDIYRTRIDPLSRVMRKELKKRGIEKLKVVYSEEPPRSPEVPTDAEREEPAVCLPGKTPVRQKVTPGSVSFVPGAAGLILAGEVIKDLIAGA